MKNTTLFLLVSFSFLFTKAQLNISAGPAAGFGHSWISGEGNNNYKAAGNFGLQIMYSPIEHFGIGGDILYSIEGGTKEMSGVEVTTRLNFLRLPITGTYFFNNYGDRVRPKISLGPSIGFLLGGKTEFNGVERDAGDDYKSIDLGLVAKGGVNLRLIPNTWLTMDVNYYHGLLDVSEIESQNNKNRNIGFNLGLLFGIGTRR